MTLAMSIPSRPMSSTGIAPTVMVWLLVWRLSGSVTAGLFGLALLGATGFLTGGVADGP